MPVRNVSYRTVRYGWIGSYEGAEIIYRDGVRALRIGVGSRGNAEYVWRHGEILEYAEDLEPRFWTLAAEAVDRIYGGPVKLPENRDRILRLLERLDYYYTVIYQGEAIVPEKLFRASSHEEAIALVRASLEYECEGLSTLDDYDATTVRAEIVDAQHCHVATLRAV